MRTLRGAGCWPGRAEGRVIWHRFQPGDKAVAPADRAGEILRFRAALGQALADIERWSEDQDTVDARVRLQSCRDLILEGAWSYRACALIDERGMAAGDAAVEAAVQIAAVFGRSGELREAAGQVAVVGRWIGRRLSGLIPGSDAVLAALDLHPLEVLDLTCPALIAGPEPVVRGTQPLVWGVRELNPDWEGRRVALDGANITLDVPEPYWWPLSDGLLNGHPVCQLNGDPEAVARMARKLGRPPAALVRRLDDLAAVPVFIRQVAAVAVDLDRLGPAPRLKHPGTDRLLREAIGAGLEAGVPVAAGGSLAEKHPEQWLDKGFTAIYGDIPLGGQRTHAIRRR